MALVVKLASGDSRYRGGGDRLGVRHGSTLYHRVYNMNVEPQAPKPRLKRTSLQPLSLEEALRKAMEYKVESKPQRGGRKKKATP